MGPDVVTQMMQAIRESITRVQASGGVEPSRAIARALAHLWQAHDELALCHRDARSPGDG